MSVLFQSIRSSSSGNCLVLRTGRTCILLDCGLRSQREARDLLRNIGQKVDAVVLSHAHSDHVNEASLAVLEEAGIPIHTHGRTIEQVSRRHFTLWSPGPRMINFPQHGNDLTFSVGDIEIQPVELPHEPKFLTHGFVVRTGRHKMVVATDFHQSDNLAGHLVDADFVFIESNHDPELLKRFWNFASTFHMTNFKTADALVSARRASRRPAQMVMLGHLSRQRNSESIALDTVRQTFDQAEIEIEFPLLIAPKYEASEVIEIK